MANPNGKSKGKKNKKGGEGEHGSGIRMKLKLLFSCIGFGLRSKDYESGDNNNNKKQDEFSSVKNEEIVSSKNKEEKLSEFSSVKHEGIVSSKNKEEKLSVIQAAEEEKVAKSTILSTLSNSVPVQPITPPNLSPRLAYPHLRNFSYNEIRLATMNFKREHFLGEGGFGRVFKGWISEDDDMSPTMPGVGIPVVVKTLNLAGLQGHREWLAEINYLSQLQHPNLVKLVGFCNQGDQRILVYEYMPRGSLDFHLFRRTHAPPLPWSTRMRIMLDAAQGLAYLHQSDNKNAVIYRDFKTSNVLLDSNYNAKLSDLGLAKDGPEGDNTHILTAVMGTQGYTAPEYVLTGRLSTKSDVYSFGVVLLEMITGRRALDKNKPPKETLLVKWAVPKIRRGGKYCHMILVDPSLKGHYSIKGSVRALALAAQCVKQKPSERPDMSRVVQVMKTLPYVLGDMAFHALSSTNVMVVGPSPNSIGGNRNHTGLRVGSSTRNVPKPGPNHGSH